MDDIQDGPVSTDSAQVDITPASESTAEVVSDDPQVPDTPGSPGFRNGKRTPNSIPPDSPSDDRLYKSEESTAAPSPVQEDQLASNDKSESQQNSSAVDDGELSDDAQDENKQGFEDKSIQPCSSPSSSEDEIEKDPKSRLQKLKTMRFTAPNRKAFSGSADQTPRLRTVRSFLHEKGAEELDSPDLLRTRRRSPTSEDERLRRKRRYEDEERRGDPRRERVDRAPVRETAVNPHTLTHKIQLLVSKADGPGADIPEDELRATVLEAFLLDRELNDLYDKRDQLTKDMHGFAALEKDLIKKIHSELPTHMQSVIKIDGDNVAINEAPAMKLPGMPPFPPFPPGMFPAMPSLLEKGGPLPPGMPPFPPGLLPPGMPPPPRGPNGMPMFPFPGMPPPPNFARPPAVPEKLESVSPEPIASAAPPTITTSTVVQTTERITASEIVELGDWTESGHFPISVANFNLPPPSISQTSITTQVNKPPPIGSNLTQGPPDGAAVPDFTKPPPVPATITTGVSITKTVTSILPDINKPPPLAPPPLSFNVPPPNIKFESGADSEPSAPYLSNLSTRPQPPSGAPPVPTPSLSAPVNSDISKTITSLITNALKGPPKPPTQQFGLMSGSLGGSPIHSLSGSASPMKNARNNPPPSLMSIPTSGPLHMGTLRIGPPAAFNRSRGTGVREIKEAPDSPRC